MAEVTIGGRHGTHASRQRDESEADHRDVWTGFRVVRDPAGSGSAPQ